MSAEAKDFISKLLVQNPKARLNGKQARYLVITPTIARAEPEGEAQRHCCKRPCTFTFALTLTLTKVLRHPWVMTLTHDSSPNPTPKQALQHPWTLTLTHDPTPTPTPNPGAAAPLASNPNPRP